MTNKFFRNQILRLLLLILCMGILHFLLLKSTLPEIYQKSSPWKIYLLLIPIEILGLRYIFVKYKKNNQSAMKSFMILMVVKMAATLIFLIPLIIFKNELTRPIVYQFFVIFFVILFAELVFLVKMLAVKLEK